MKITSIKQQVKRTDRYSIYVDGSYSFSLSESALLSSGVVNGQELTGREVDDYKKLSAEDKLYGQALRYAAMRPRSVWEITSYLQRKGAVDAAAEQLVAKLIDLGLVNDRAYAASFVHDRQLLRPTSHRKLKLELQRKRIASDDIQAALGSDDLDEQKSLQEVITKKRRQSKYQDDQKLMQYLARQGFGYGDIKSALHSDELD